VKFAKIVFRIAGAWGVLILTPLYFMFRVIGAKDPPPLTHPAFFYGFIGAGLAWQLAFFVIAQNPARFRPLMLPAMFEKFSYGLGVAILFLQGRIHKSDLILNSLDLVWGVLFIIAFIKTPHLPDAHQ
jgi:hypothetical protein